MKKYYVGMDVHKATIAIAVLDAFGKLIAQSVIETSTQAVRDFFHTWRGEAHVTCEEGNHAAWLYDVVNPLVKRVVVCNPKHNRKLMDGSKNDRIDARKLAELLRIGAVKAVYHGEHGTRTLKHLMRGSRMSSQRYYTCAESAQGALQQRSDQAQWAPVVSRKSPPGLDRKAGEPRAADTSRALLPSDG